MTVIIPGRPQRPVTVQPGRDLPPGGTAGQALIKSSDSDFATTWGTATSSAAWGAITGTLASQTDLQSALDAKQVALVSGANIKTVNGSNILGAGDLVVSSSIADGDKGDITVSGSGATWTIDNAVVTNAKLADMPTARFKGRTTAGTGEPEDLTAAQATALLDTFVASGGSHKKGLVPDPPASSGTAKFLREDATWAQVTESIIVAASDETTALTTGSAKVTFRMPYAFTLTAVRASLTTAQTSGTIFTVDINEAGTTVLSTKLTIDNTEKTSTTAATAAVISDTSLADDAEMTVDIDQIGDGTAKGLKITLIGFRT